MALWFYVLCYQSGQNIEADVSADVVLLS